MRTDKEWNDLLQEHDPAYFKANVCLGSPQSFSLDEKKRICDEMQANTAAVDAALKADFESLPPAAQSKLLDMLCASGCMTPEWWKETLFGKMPESPA